MVMLLGKLVCKASQQKKVLLSFLFSGSENGKVRVSQRLY